MRRSLKNLSRACAALFVTALFATPWGCNNAAEIPLDDTIIEITDGQNASRYSGSASGLLNVTVAASSGLNESLLDSPEILGALVRAKTLVSDSPRTGAVNISDDFAPCPVGGTVSFSGELAFTADADLVDVGGTFAQTFSSCAATTLVIASDGECELTTEFTGSMSVDYAFNYETDSGDFLVASSLTTSAPLDLVQNDVAHTVLLDLFFMQDSTTDPTFSGTITVDGLAYDAAIELDTQSFSRAELGCE